MIVIEIILRALPGLPSGSRLEEEPNPEGGLPLSAAAFVPVSSSTQSSLPTSRGRTLIPAGAGNVLQFHSLVDEMKILAPGVKHKLED